jgi:hypothetical protein
MGIFFFALCKLEEGNPYLLRLAIFTLMDLFPIMVIKFQA